MGKELVSGLDGHEYDGQDPEGLAALDGLSKVEERLKKMRKLEVSKTNISLYNFNTMVYRLVFYIMIYFKKLACFRSEQRRLERSTPKF